MEFEKNFGNYIYSCRLQNARGVLNFLENEAGQNF